jgi:hypothetical protein
MCHQVAISLGCRAKGATNVPGGEALVPSQRAIALSGRHFAVALSFVMPRGSIGGAVMQGFAPLARVVPLAEAIVAPHY